MKQNNGAGLLITILCMGILAAMAVYQTSFIRNKHTDFLTYAFSKYQKYLRSDISEIFYSHEACINNLGRFDLGKLIDGEPLDIDYIDRISGHKEIKINEEYVFFLYPEKMQLKNWKLGHKSSNYIYGTAELYFLFSGRKKELKHDYKINFSVPLYLKLAKHKRNNAYYNLETCYNDSKKHIFNARKNICSMLGGILHNDKCESLKIKGETAFEGTVEANELCFSGGSSNCLKSWLDILSPLKDFSF